jgi:hypothetical protein
MHRKECEPSIIGQYPGLSEALRNGQRLHGFRSGGGLRVVSLHDGKGYGEHPYIYNALDHAEEDYQAGGREYSKVYGKIHDHYYTGANPKGGFDSWVCAGRAFDFVFKNEKFVFKSKYSKQRFIPKEIHNRVTETRIAEQWKSEDGLLFEITPFVFPGNGKLGSSAKCLDEDAKNVWFKKTLVSFKADSLYDLIVLLDKEFSESKKWE